MPNWSVGVFDSGIGGLTVLNECARRLRGCRFYYLGDNARAPYGSRGAEEIFAFVAEAMRQFADLGVDAAVLACNTATAVCAERVRRMVSFPVIGAEPALLPAFRVCRRPLLLATRRTAESLRVKALLARRPAHCRVTVRSCAELAGAIEAGFTLGTPFSLPDLLPSFSLAEQPDGVVLGCTHYVFLKREISAFYGAPVFDGNAGIARRLESLLCAAENLKIGTDDHFLGGKNRNKCSFENREICAKNELIFLGLTKNINKMQYEHMFTC